MVLAFTIRIWTPPPQTEGKQLCKWILHTTRIHILALWDFALALRVILVRVEEAWRLLPWMTSYKNMHSSICGSVWLLACVLLWVCLDVPVVFVYVHMFLYVHMIVHVQMFVYVHMISFVHMFVYVHMFVFVNMCVVCAICVAIYCVCANVCVVCATVCMYRCVCMCMCMCMYVPVHVRVPFMGAIYVFVNVYGLLCEVMWQPPSVSVFLIHGHFRRQSSTSMTSHTHMATKDAFELWLCRGWEELRSYKSAWTKGRCLYGVGHYVVRDIDLHNNWRRKPWNWRNVPCKRSEDKLDVW